MTSENARSPRALALTGVTQSALAQLLAVEHWLASGGRDDALLVPERDFSVEVGAVAAAEAAAGGRLSDDALALFAAGSATLTREYQLTLAMVGDHTAQARAAGAPRSLLAIGRAEPELFLCVQAAATASERTRLFFFSPGASPSREAIEGFLGGVIEQALDDLELSEGQWRRIRGDEFGAAFMPRLVIGAGPIQGADALPRVTHAKFGEGVVLRELSDGGEAKLEIDFGAAGRKILLARFVRAVDKAS